MASGILSGGPSTAIALARGDNLLESTRAAGTLLGKRSVLRGLVAHILITVGWTSVLAVVLPRRRPVVEGLLAGAAIGAIGIGVVGRRYPDIAALDPVPQLLDNVAYGVIASVLLSFEQ